MEETNRVVKGLWIPIEIWKDKNLSWNEKILFLEIDSFTTMERDCYISDEHISEFLGISTTNANKTLSSLIKKGYVVKTRFDGRKRYVRSALSYSTDLTCQNQQTPCAHNNNTTIDSNTISTNTITNKKELKEKFANFVVLYKKMGGKVRGVDTEFNDFTKRHKDWATIIPYLETAVKREEKARTKAKEERKFFPEPKMLQTYLGKQRAWELYVTIGEEINSNEYTPTESIELRWNDVYKCYLYTGQSWNPKPQAIYDGYTPEERPNGARIMLNNGRGYIHWSSEFKEWLKD